MGGMSNEAVSLRIIGRVQGVAFRATCEQEAQRLGVAGWVRNETDGSVEVHAEGEREAVDSLVDWCRHGPSGARVDDVEASPAEPTGGSGFRTTA